MSKEHNCPKITSEAENDNFFSFLDISITRHSQQLETSILTIYNIRKSTCSGAFTHYES